jgi:hypothetical protein
MDEPNPRHARGRVHGAGVFIQQNLTISISRSFAASNARKVLKNCQSAAILNIFAKIELRFKLSWLPYTAYRAAVGHAGLRGSAVRFYF